jgi:NAD(P)-dependent dehydrogenase (short-subunit alcohol dehydrogenase family)
MSFHYEFTGRVAVVTGGSDGLGFDFCRTLSQAGCEVFFCGRNAERGEGAAQKMGPRAHFIQTDISEAQQIAGFAARVRQAAGKIDFLVNNVAMDDRIPFADLTAETCDRIWQTNLRSYLLATRAFLDLLRAGEGKSIVNICTTNYMFGLEPFTLYNATKSGILGFTRSLARELGREGIRANTVSPGWIMTGKQLREHVSEQDKSDLLRDQALKFLLEPGHVTPAVLFLLSSAAFGITGQNLVVDGGKYMQ